VSQYSPAEAGTAKVAAVHNVQTTNALADEKLRMVCTPKQSRSMACHQK
jgi:hypothetical protein